MFNHQKEDKGLLSFVLNQTEIKNKPKKVGHESFKGKRIYKLIDHNPRKRGTKAALSWEIIINGMRYETYLLSGGCKNELAVNLRDHFVKLE